MTDHPRSSNPFYSEENDDDNEYGYNQSGRRNFNEPPSDPRRHKMEQIDNSENRQLESTRRAIASIYDSERMGVATAEELLRQGEQLDNIEQKTQEIDQTMSSSQKHLNNIKSVFGGIKNWWSGGSKSESKQPQEERPSKLKDTLEEDNLRDPGGHPALRLKSDDCRGFYQDDDELDSRFMAAARKPANAGGREQQHIFQPITKSVKEKELEQNIDLMSGGMSKLKGLAMALGDEIETQNDQLDRINVKVDNTSTNLEGQNKQMRHILYKK